MPTPTDLPISAVERETQLSKDVLRAWEKRYGFPTPQRDANGERCYPADQVERLRLMKRLVDSGHRPGRLARLPAAELASLAVPAAPAQQAAQSGDTTDKLDELLDTVQQSPAAFGPAMRNQLARHGLERFVKHVAAPLTGAVGSRWEEGRFDVFDEHFYTEETSRVLRQAIDTVQGPGGAPHIILTTLPGETHGLGLLMAEALLALDGARCVSLGTETPVASIARAASAYDADVVALSFSIAYPRRRIAAALAQVRQALPAQVAVWAGGAGVAGCPAVEGVHLLPTLDGGRLALAAWRAVHGRP